MDLILKLKDCLSNAEKFEELCDYWKKLYEDPANARKEFIKTLFNLSGWKWFHYESDFHDLSDKINNKNNYFTKNINLLNDECISLLKKFISKIYCDNNGKIFDDFEFTDVVIKFLTVAHTADSEGLRMLSLVIGFEILASRFNLISSKTYNKDHPGLTKYFLCINDVLVQGEIDPNIEINLAFASGIKHLATTFPLFMLKNKWFKYWDNAVDRSCRPEVATILLEALQIILVNQIGDLEAKETTFNLLRQDFFRIIKNQEGPQAICVSIIIKFDEFHAFNFTKDEIDILFQCYNSPNAETARSTAMFCVKKGFVRTTSPAIFEDILDFPQVLTLQGQAINLVESFYDELSNIPWIEWTSFFTEVSSNQLDKFCSLLFWYAKKSVHDFESSNRKKIKVFDAEELVKNQTSFMTHFSTTWMELVNYESIKGNLNAFLYIISLVEFFDDSISFEDGVEIIIMLKNIFLTNHQNMVITCSSFMLHKVSKIEKLSKTVSYFIFKMVPIISAQLAEIIDHRDDDISSSARLRAISVHHNFDDEPMWSLAFQYLKRLNVPETGDSVLVMLCIELLFNLLYSRHNEYLQLHDDSIQKQKLRKIILERVTNIPIVVVPFLSVEDELMALPAFSAMSKIYFDFGCHAVRTPLSEFAVNYDDNILKTLADVFTFIPSNVTDMDIINRCVKALEYVSPLFINGLIPVAKLSQLLFVCISEELTSYINITCDCITEYRKLNPDDTNGLVSALLKSAEDYGFYFGENTNDHFFEEILSNKQLYDAIGRSAFIQVFFKYIEEIKAGNLQYDIYLPYFLDYLLPEDTAKLLAIAEQMEETTPSITYLIDELTSEQKETSLSSSTSTLSLDFSSSSTLS